MPPVTQLPSTRFHPRFHHLPTVPSAGVKPQYIGLWRTLKNQIITVFKRLLKSWSLWSDFFFPKCKDSRTFEQLCSWHRAVASFTWNRSAYTSRWSECKGWGEAWRILGCSPAHCRGPGLAGLLRSFHLSPPTGRTADQGKFTWGLLSNQNCPVFLRIWIKKLISK
jgi:hypothetical protein